MSGYFVSSGHIDANLAPCSYKLSMPATRVAMLTTITHLNAPGGFDNINVKTNTRRTRATYAHMRQLSQNYVTHPIDDITNVA